MHDGSIRDLLNVILSESCYAVIMGLLEFRQSSHRCLCFAALDVEKLVVNLM